MTTSIWWIRRDLRLADNEALRAALASGERVVPVYVLDPALLVLPAAGEKRLAFLFEGLRDLGLALRERGSRLVVRQGEPAAELSRLAAELDGARVCAEGDPWPYARRRDAVVGSMLPLNLVSGLTVHPWDLVRREGGSPYTVFTPFSRAWKTLPMPDSASLFDPPLRLPPVPAHLEGVEIPVVPARHDRVPFPAGEAEALRRLRVFAGGSGDLIRGYGETRNRLDLDGTSRLSPYLRFGMVSARRCAVAAGEVLAGVVDPVARRGAEAWLAELIWRDFYMQILYHFPGVLHEAFRPALRSVAWREGGEGFAAWCSARTGYAVVDAAMRQLVLTGWMPNRARMITASFLVKDLLVDWRAGERFFMEHLVDGDPAANNGGWQWVAGVGTDASPYFRVFNPSLQGVKFDPDGAYVRRWVPELTRVPSLRIHQPWLMAPAEQQAAGCVIGRDYPEPIVDHAMARGRALRLFKEGRA